MSAADLTALAVVVAMGLVTYATRAGGVAIMGLVPLTSAVERFLRHMGSGVIVAVLLGVAWRGDIAMNAAIAVSLAVMAITRSAAFGMAAAVLAAAATRASGWG